MGAVFPPWSNGAFRMVVAGSALGVVGVPCALMVLVRTPYVTGEGEPIEQPVMFDHRHHVRDNGMDCRYCHSTVETASFAGMPPTERCMGCHGQIWPDSPLLAPVRKSWIEDRPIVWARVNKLPDFLKFDHSSHVQKGVGCVECHGRVDEMAEVRQAQPLTMGFCIDCHRAPQAHLRPLDRITDMTWAPDGPRAEIGRALGASLQVAPSTDCTTCHM